MSIYVIVADSSRARFLAASKVDQPLRDAKDFIHSESRLREQDLVSDGSGSDGDSGGYGRHSMGHEKSAQEQEARIFARQLADEVEKIRQGGEARRIYLVAPPKFLGLLRTSLSKQCIPLIAGEVNKDLVDHGIDDIRAHLPKKL